jgi:hypothetical protein
MVEDRPPVPQFSVVLNGIRSSLAPFFKEGIDCSVSCGREFLRFGFDRAVISDFVPNFQLNQKFFANANASADFLSLRNR